MSWLASSKARSCGRPGARFRAGAGLLAAAVFVLAMTPSTVRAESSDLVSRTVDFFTFRYDFLLYSAAGSALVGATCGLLGVFLVLKRLSLMGDALGHAAFPGVGLSFLVVQSKDLFAIVIGAAATAITAALTIGFVTRNSRTRPDAALGIVLTGFFGAGVVIFSYLQNSPTAAQAGLNDFLFGNAAAIRPEEVALLGGLLVLSLLFVVLFYRPLSLATFDETLARLSGVPTRALHYGLIALVALAIVAGMQSVGAVLVAAMVIIPAATAELVTRRLPYALLASAVIGACSGVLGSLLSFLFDGFSSGPSMVLVAGVGYALALLLSPVNGLLGRWLRRRSRAAMEAA